MLRAICVPIINHYDLVYAASLRRYLRESFCNETVYVVSLDDNAYALASHLMPRKRIGNLC